jgi:hypothetical protein
MRRTANHYVIIGRNERGPVAQWIPSEDDSGASGSGARYEATVVVPTQNEQAFGVTPSNREA